MLDVGEPVGSGEEEDRGEDDGEERDGVEKIRHGGRVLYEVNTRMECVERMNLVQRRRRG